MIRFLCFVCFSCLTFVSTRGFGASVETGRIFVEEEVPIPPGFSLGTHYFSDDGNGTFFRLEGTTIVYTGVTLGLDAFWYIVNEGDVFSQATIEAGMFPKISFNPGDSVAPRTDLGTLGDHYFGVTGESFRDFGWVKLRLSEDSPIVLSDALTNSPWGIVVGTLNIVPEPSASSGLGFMMVMILQSMRKRRGQMCFEVTAHRQGS